MWRRVRKALLLLGLMPETCADDSLNPLTVGQSKRILRLPPSARTKKELIRKKIKQQLKVRRKPTIPNMILHALLEARSTGRLPSYYKLARLHGVPPRGRAAQRAFHEAADRFWGRSSMPPKDIGDDGVALARKGMRHAVDWGLVPPLEFLAHCFDISSLEAARIRRAITGLWQQHNMDNLSTPERKELFQQGVCVPTRKYFREQKITIREPSKSTTRKPTGRTVTKRAAVDRARKWTGGAMKIKRN
mmetsp:Transcript_15168/g.32953  ORF Transcript_15168/g.32953 Transcript_15168/m.32953 type:complete len:247 (-) Transcript_15168:13-753(-)